MAKDITKIKHRFPVISKTTKLLANNWLCFLLIVFSLVLSFLNYRPGTTLTGWDNLHPEYNFLANIRRSVFAVWQEYQSLGLLGGHAHATDIVRQILLGGLSIFLPTEILRYLWTFFMLTIGPLGVYVFLNSFFLKHKFDDKTIHFASFLGGLFYLLNLSTVQHFFTPFETFTAFYGFFPWLIVFLFFFLAKPTFRRFLVLFLINFLASPAYYTETMFVVYGLCVLIIIMTNLFQPHHKHTLSEIVSTFLAIGLANAYWLLPAIFFVITNGSVGLLAKINSIATSETYYRNLAYGDLGNIAILRGFWFGFLDLAAGNKFDYLMLPWRNHLDNPTILILSFLFFALIVTGAIYSFIKKLHLRRSILGIFLLCFFFLLGGGLLFNQTFPLVGELFRSPFTKFSVALSFTYSVFFAIGAIFLLDLFSFLHSRLTYYLTLFTVSLALIIFMTPAFTGNLISPAMRLSIPTEYFETFDFFKNQDPATRIANFPQYTFWGWNYYSWGYRGSGFLWYGIKQPILDRAFDVWERSSEKYYEEISTALYSENKQEFEKLIDKYAINWILLDQNVISPNANQDLGNEKLLAFLNSSSKFTLAKNIDDKILIYKTNIEQKVKNFLSTSQTTEPPTSPFADLSLRPQPTKIVDDRIIFETKVGGQLILPSYSQTENLVPTAISYRKTEAGLQLKFAPILPEIKSGQKIITPTATPIFLDFNLPPSASGLILGVNDQYLEVALPDELSVQSTFYPLTDLYLSTKQITKVALYSNTPIFKQDLTTPLAAATPSQCYTSKPNRKIEKIAAGKTISLFGIDLVGCLSAPISTASVNQLIALEFIYQSSTGTPANANVTNRHLGGENSPQPITSQSRPTFARVFAKPLLEPLQVNLILEANESKSTQEIVYQNVTVNYLPLLGESSFITNAIPSIHQNLEPNSSLSISIPIVTNPFTITVSPDSANLNPEARNCDNFNQGQFTRETTPNGFLYSATNANSCDQINLKHLPHNVNYGLIFTVQNQTGLFPTVCLENYATRRCDVFERLIAGRQLLIQPITNSTELPGYTLHLFNQSFGSRETANLIQGITITPLPLNFLKNITFGDQLPPSADNRPVTTGTHPAEFLYTAQITAGTNEVLNLYQTQSPYWKALEVSESDLQLPLWLLIAKLPYLYFSPNRLAMNRAEGAGVWYNSWDLPTGDHSLVIFYLPQYLEFVGFALLLLPLLTIPVYILFIRKKGRPKK